MCPAFYGKTSLMKGGILDDDGGYFYYVNPQERKPQAQCDWLDLLQGRAHNVHKVDVCALSLLYVLEGTKCGAKRGQISLLCEFETKKRIDLATSNYILPQLEVVSFKMVPLRHVVYYVNPQERKPQAQRDWLNLL